MAEIDYQMALLLQHRFEQETKTSKNSEESDQVLARELQQQFELEQTTDRPSNGLVYKPPKSGHNSSRSLVDPSWELVDPTPDIHNLFMVFNERFFWNQLLAVCVSWSKRMTSCAGICSYNGRGGMCSITLSEPLLKLRPRKDLVETLLHEMIHAFLFVTHNNKDRDGHGPEFHKHMFRINKESGTNITVYHDFHDEVRLYKQHWWRCNGPCQQRKPFFGMVRRATNRAPGPNDRWWGEHSRTCGGTFIKVKEPENNKKEKKVESKNISTTKNKDIRDFFNSKSGDSSNVKGFKDLNKVKGGKLNSSSTIVVTKNSSSNNQSSFTPTIFNAGTSGTVMKTNNQSSFTPTIFNAGTSGTATKTNNHSSFSPTVFNAGTSSGTVKKTTSGTSQQTSDDFISVRNHWANKFGATNKRLTEALVTGTTNKRPAEPPATGTKILKVAPPEELCDCPVCNKKLPMKDLNAHLDLCLNDPPPLEDEKECPVCSKTVASSIFETHIEECLNKIEEKEPPETVSCLACGKKILKADLNSHLDDCMVGIFDGDSDSKTEDQQPSNSQFNCPFCMKLVEECEMKEHIDGCLLAERDFMESFMDEF